MDRLQRALNFEGWAAHPQFRTSSGLGRVGLAGFALGVALGVHLCWLCVVLFVLGPRGHLLQLRWTVYVLSLTAFHFLEFFTTALFKPATVSYDSFIINHSHAYTLAALASWTEFWVEAWLFPGTKRLGLLVMLAGGVLMFTGQVFRVAAMWTAGANFNHLIMERREPGHRLVTHGVFRVLRHPSYFGWFWWCVGTQVTLANPLCTVLYALAAWDFFRKRIPFEEATLTEFYPDQYPEYAQRTRVGIPFIPSVKYIHSAAAGGASSSAPRQRARNLHD